MKQLESGTVLYHGSYCSVENPDLEKCALYKDFGKTNSALGLQNQFRNLSI